LFLLPGWRTLRQTRSAAAIALLPAIGLSLLQNKAITGSWTTLPYALSRYQYGVPAAFTWQENPQPHEDLTREQELQYKMQTSFRAGGNGDHSELFTAPGIRVRFYRFFFLAPLYVALPFFLLAARASVLVGDAHAPALRARREFLSLLRSPLSGRSDVPLLAGRRQRAPPDDNGAARLIVYLCLAHFAFWYSRSFFDPPAPERRAAVNRQIAQSPGKQLVFVRYWPQHIFQDEWVYNAANIDRSRVVWARDLGSSENQKLLRYYPDRTAWLLEPDAMPPKLTRYQAEVEQPGIVLPAPKPKLPTANKPPLRFEQVY
jgi:hypothetical protein